MGLGVTVAKPAAQARGPGQSVLATPKRNVAECGIVGGACFSCEFIISSARVRRVGRIIREWGEMQWVDGAWFGFLRALGPARFR